MSFQVALNNVLITLMFILPGYISCKIRQASADHLPTLSGVLIYGCSPCMIIATFMKLDFSWDVLGQLGIFFLASMFCQCAFIGLMWLILRDRTKDAKYRVLTMAMTMGNVGFFGLPIIRALLPEFPFAVCYSCAFVVSMNILVFTVGIFCLTGEKKYISLKQGICNPSTLALIVGIFLYIARFGSWLPQVVASCVDTLGNMTTPLCMIILGIRLAMIPFKRLFVKPIVYVACIGKLLIFPLFCYGVSFLLPVSDIFRCSILILASTPCANIILSMAQILNSEQQMAANCVLVSTLVCFITIPLLTLLT